MIIMALLSYAKSVLHIVIALKNVTFVGNIVEMIDFAVTQVDNFCKNELIIVMFKLFDGKDTFQTETIFEFVCLNVQLYPYNND